MLKLPESPYFAQPPMQAIENTCHRARMPESCEFTNKVCFQQLGFEKRTEKRDEKRGERLANGVNVQENLYRLFVPLSRAYFYYILSFSYLSISLSLLEIESIEQNVRPYFAFWRLQIRKYLCVFNGLQTIPV